MSMTWVLIIFAHVGAFGKTDSNAMTSVPGFYSQQECEAAGAKAKQLVAGTVKDLAFVCVKQTNIGEARK